MLRTAVTLKFPYQAVATMFTNANLFWTEAEQHQTLRMPSIAMTQESVAIDYQSLIREPTTTFKLYVLFLMIVCIVTCIKLIKVWVAVPPFRAASKTASPAYSALLRGSSRSLKQWIGSVILSYALLFSTSVYGVCRDVLNDNRVGGTALFFIIKDYAAALSMALLVISIVFLVRWHLVRRIERLAENTLPT